MAREVWTAMQRKWRATRASGRLARLGLVFASAATALLVTASPAAACSGPYPSFREAAPGAQRVVIGDVSAIMDPTEAAESDGWSTRFVVRVLWTLRGEPAAEILVDHHFATACLSYLAARLGDRLALAIDARREPLLPSSGPIFYAAAAWIRGTPPEADGVERITVSEAFRLLGLEPPQTSTAPARTAPWHPVALLVAAVVGLLLARARRQAHGLPTIGTPASPP